MGKAVPWSGWEEHLAVVWKTKVGLEEDEIGRRLGRSPKAVETRISLILSGKLLGRNSKPPRETRHDYVKKKRNCLRCGQSFKSQWFGNRMCNTCLGNRRRETGMHA